LSLYQRLLKFMNFMFASKGHLFISQSIPSARANANSIHDKRDLRLFFIFCTRLKIKSSKYL